MLDVGGDYIGARSIGGYAPLLNRDGTTVYYVINPFRPWSATLEHIDQVLGRPWESPMLSWPAAAGGQPQPWAGDHPRRAWRRAPGGSGSW